jgi:hypothetical protein
MMSIKDITWINNNEASDVQRVMGVPFHKIVDKVLSAFFNLKASAQHDGWRDLVTTLDKCKSSQLQILKHIAGQTGKRKSIILESGKTSHTNKAGYDYGKANQFVKTYKKDDTAIKLVCDKVDKTQDYWDITADYRHFPGKMLVKVIGDTETRKYGLFWGESLCYDDSDKLRYAKTLSAQIEGQQRPRNVTAQPVVGPNLHGPGTQNRFTSLYSAGDYTALGDRGDPTDRPEEEDPEWDYRDRYWFSSDEEDERYTRKAFLNRWRKRAAYKPIDSTE